MINSLVKSIVFCVIFLLSGIIISQNKKSEPLWGTPCAECVKSNIENAKGGSSIIQNGNGTIATSYTATACGLNFTQVSVRLNKRSFSITPATGVNQPATFAISGLPPCFQILKAYLYAGTSGNGIAVTANITNPAATASTIPMSIIGTDVDKCWGYAATYTYRGDVTALISGNGNYIISGLPVTVGSNDTDGATLFIVYSDPSQNYTGSIVIGDGCMVAKGGTKNATLTGFNVCGPTSLTTNFMIIADLQKIAATALTLNGAAYSHPIANQNVWDYVQQPGGAATSGQTTASYGCSNASDCFNVCMAGMYYRTACNVCTTTNLTVTAVTSSSCSAGSATANVLGGTAPYSYTWSPTGGNAASITNMPSGTYTVNVKDATGCKTGTATVVVNAAAGPTITANSGTICAGSSVNLIANGAISYTWSPSTGLSTTNGSVVVANPVSTTVFSISGTNSIGCVATITTNVLVNPMPVPVINSNSPVCINAPINLTSSGGTTYNWNGPNAFSSAVQNPTITNAQPTNGGVYTVSVTSLGCTSTASVNVTVLNPTTTASNTGPYCAGATIQLNTAAASSYSWNGPLGFTSTLQNPNISNATTAMAGTYSVIATIGTCTTLATTAVVVNPLPTPAATNTGPYCPGNTIQLNVGAFTTYTWSGPSAYSSNVQNATVPSAAVSNGGVYTVTVTNASGCVNTSTTNVVVNPSPVPVVGSNSPVCLNNNINLTASGGTSYSWSGPNAFSSALQNPTISAATSMNSGVYTVTVTALGCMNTGTVSVTVLTPTTTASNTGAYCAGSTIQLNTPTASSYTWTGPGGFASNLQNPTIPVATIAMSGTYSVLVSVGTCTANATTNVIVNALPTPTALSNSPVCAATPINLTGSGGTTYTWTGPGGFTSNNQNPVISSATSANAGTNTLTVTDANGCVNSTTVIVVVNPLPIITVNNPTVCVNQSIGLTSTGGATYAWSGPSGFTSNQQNPNIASAALNMGGTYTVTVTTAAGCSNTAVSNVQVFALPNPQIMSNTPVCSGGSLNLSGTGGASFAWAGPNSFMSLQQNPTISNVSLAASGVYTLLVSSGSCTASTTASVTINPLPNPQIVSNSPVCVNQPINLTGSGGVSYAWSGPGFISNVQNPVINSAAVNNSGTYTLTVTDANNCVNSITQNVIVNPLPNATAVGGTACENSNVSLTATGGVNYSWSGPGGFTATGSNVNIPNAQTSSNGQYTVTVTDANNCTSTAMTMITVNPAPVANIVTNSPICENTTLNLSGTGGVSYQWSGPNGYFSSSQNPSINSVSASYSGNYNLTVTDANGCSASTSTAVTINPIPNAIIASSNNVGCAPMCVTFTLNSTSQIANYTWNLGNGVSGNTASQQTCYTTTGVYTINVSVSDAIGCSSSATYTVQVYPQPVADFNHAPIKPIINIDPDVVFTDASYGANIVSWNWYFMNNAQYTSTQQNPTFMYTEPGTYAVALVVKSDKGCMDTLVRPLVVGEDFGIYVPNAFTPNADGLNDIFLPKGFGIVKYELQIFDRWGERIFTTKEISEGWDGKYMGRGGDICEEATYTWLINVTSVFGKAHELKGHVTLIK